MRRFLVNRKTAFSSGSEIVNLGFGCEMWDQGPVAVIETFPPYPARWFPNLNALKKAAVFLPQNGQVAGEQQMQIDLFMVDEQEVNYWTMLASKFGVSTESITLTIESGLLLPAGNTITSISEPKDMRPLYQSPRTVHREKPLSRNRSAMINGG